MSDEPVELLFTEHEIGVYVSVLRETVMELRSQIEAIVDQQMTVPGEDSWQKEKRTWAEQHRAKGLNTQIATALRLIRKLERRQYLLVKFEVASEYLWFGSEIVQLLVVGKRNTEAAIVACLPGHTTTQLRRYQSGYQALADQAFVSIESLRAWAETNKDIL